MRQCIHIRKDDENTLKRVYNLHSESKSLGFSSTTLYISVLNKTHFESLNNKVHAKNNKLHAKLEENDLNILVFSPYKDPIKDVASLIQRKKINMCHNKIFDTVTAISVLLTIGIMDLEHNRITIPILSIIMAISTVIFGLLSLFQHLGYLSFMNPYSDFNYSQTEI